MSSPSIHKDSRILALLTDAYGGHGGISRFNRDLLIALAAADECNEVVALPRLVSHPIDEVIPDKINFVNNGVTTKPGYLQHLFKWLLSDRRFDLVICGHINMLPIAWFAARFLRVPLVMIIHGIDAWQPHQSRLVNTLSPRVDRLVAVSQTTVDRFHQWSKIADDKTFVLPNCVDLSGFSPGPKSEALLERYGLTGKKIIMTLGRMAGLDRYKGFDEVLEAMPQLLKEIPALVYLLAGDGPDKERLEKKAEALGITESTVFTGMVAEEEKVDHYRLADAYVMPSRGEGFGIVLLEAMSCGVPVMASKLDGSREALLDGKMGTLVDPTDMSEVICGIKHVLSLPPRVPADLDYFSKASFQIRVRTLLRESLGLWTT